MMWWMTLLGCALASGDPDAPRRDLPVVEGCPRFGPGEAVGALAEGDLSELSGLVARGGETLGWWGHNDSGHDATLFAVGADGRAAGRWSLPIPAVDWEDLARGRGEDGRDWLFVADTGDNRHVRSVVTVYRLPEPADPNAPPPAPESTSYRYPDGRAHNVEAALIDPRDGALYLVTKSDDGVSEVFSDPTPQRRYPEAALLTHVGTLRFGSPPLDNGFKVTAGDFAPDGSGFALRTYTSAFFWRTPGGGSVAEALTGTPCPLPLEDEPQGETLAFAPDGASYVTASEGRGSPIWRFSRLP